MNTENWIQRTSEIVQMNGKSIEFDIEVTQPNEETQKIFGSGSLLVSDNPLYPDLVSVAVILAGRLERDPKLFLTNEEIGCIRPHTEASKVGLLCIARYSGAPRKLPEAQSSP